MTKSYAKAPLDYQIFSFTLPPAQVQSPTSVEASEKIEAVATTLRQRVYHAIMTAGERGMTDEEIQGQLGMNPSTERPRRLELAKAKMIRLNGATRPTASGRRAAVWVACR